VNTAWRARAQEIARSGDVIGGVVPVLLALALWTRFDLHAWVNRDSFLYLYGGERVLAGQPPYVSMMDPKGPISSILAAGGIEVARIFGRNDIQVVRIEFLALAVAGALGVYLLVRRLTGAWLPAMLGAIVFTTFRSFAFNAVAGPEGHLPGDVFLIFTLWLTLSRRWYLAGIAGALAFLTWQPLFIFPIAVLVCAIAWSPDNRGRAALTALGGLATPTILLVIYYGWGGHLRALFNGLVLYPVTGVVRHPSTLTYRIVFFFRDTHNIYGPVAYLLYLGLIVLLGAAVWTVVTAPRRGAALLDPLVLLMAGTLLVQLLYIAYDYIGYPHSFTVLPYAVAGLGWGLAKLLAPAVWGQQQWFRPALAALVAVLVVFSFVSFSRPAGRRATVAVEQAGACAIQRSLVPGTPLWTIDNPGPLVLLHRRQPDNYPYVGGGLDVWKVRHTRGGFRGWMHQIQASHTSIVVFMSWLWGKYQKPIRHWLYVHGYRRGTIGIWKVYVNKAARARMAAEQIAFTHGKRTWPSTTTGKRYTVTNCPVPSTSTARRGFAPNGS
jgi:hypothetical protein